jgi:hypothetical protein
MDFPDGGAALDLDVAWIHGSAAAKYNTDPDVQVHACDEHTYILRQNKAVHYEAPFMFLLFGASRAVLLDTGATANPDPGVDYPVGWSYQPDEAPLELTTGHLEEIQRTIEAHDHQPDRYVLPQMIITPVG